MVHTLRLPRLTLLTLSEPGLWFLPNEERESYVMDSSQLAGNRNKPYFCILDLLDSGGLSGGLNLGTTKPSDVLEKISE